MWNHNVISHWCVSVYICVVYADACACIARWSAVCCVCGHCWSYFIITSSTKMCFVKLVWLKWWSRVCSDMQRCSRSLMTLMQVQYHDDNELLMVVGSNGDDDVDKFYVSAKWWILMCKYWHQCHFIECLHVSDEFACICVW